MREVTTDSQAAPQPDSEASLRAELASHLARAQIDLASQLSALLANTDEPGLILNLRDRLLDIAALQENVATMRGGALVALRSAVQASVGATDSLVQQIRALTDPNAKVSPELMASGVALRDELATAHANLFERRIFDASLSFTSDEDKAEYLRREAEARRYIEAQRALHTPEGDLNAGGGAMGQMLDAHAHGAGKNAEFMPQWKRLVETTQRHRAAMLADGRSTEEFDRNLRASVRHHLKARGLSETEIDQALSSGVDPLEVVAPYLKDPASAAELKHAFDAAGDRVEATRQPITAAATLAEPANAQPSTKSNEEELSDVMATFRAAGIKVGPPSATVADASRPTTIGKSLAAGPRTPG